jgi:hypothetical protein
MFWSAAATATALLHLAFVLFVLFGGLALLRWPQLVWIHLPAAVWGVLIELFGWWCPLTRWENLFLARAGKSGYENGFVAHYLMPLIYPPGLTRGMEIAIGIGVLVLNVGMYVRVLSR